MRDFFEFYKESFYYFGGRCRRSFFFGILLIWSINFIVFSSVFSIFPNLNGWIGILLFIQFIVFSFPMVSAVCNRLHDFGFSGFFAIIFVLIYFTFGFGVFLVLALGLGAIPSQKGENKYGDNPIEPAIADLFD